MNREEGVVLSFYRVLSQIFLIPVGCSHLRNQLAYYLKSRIETLAMYYF